MTVKEVQEQLRLAKNKDAKVLFRVGDQTFDVDVMAEVVEDASGVRFPALGETTNAVAIKLKESKVAGE